MCFYLFIADNEAEQVLNQMITYIGCYKDTNLDDWHNSLNSEASELVCKHGGQLRKRGRRTAGHGVTWNDKHPTEANGALWPRPYVFQNTKRIK